MTGESMKEAIYRNIAERDAARRAEVEEGLKKLTERERRILREAAVMGYVRGVLAGQCGDFNIPNDTAVQNEVVTAIFAMPSRLYPVIHSLKSE